LYKNTAVQMRRPKASTISDGGGVLSRQSVLTLEVKEICGG